MGRPSVFPVCRHDYVERDVGRGAYGQLMLGLCTSANTNHFWCGTLGGVRESGWAKAPNRAVGVIPLQEGVRATSANWSHDNFSICDL